MINNLERMKSIVDGSTQGAIAETVEALQQHVRDLKIYQTELEAQLVIGY